MPSRRPLALALLLALSAAPLARAGEGSPKGGAKGAPRTLTLLYLADLGGQLEPCGCSFDQRGGLPRLASAVAAVRKEAPGALLVAGGDLLFESAGPLDPERAEADRVKARAVAETLRAMGLAAATVGERDLAAGEPFLRSLKLPLVKGKRLGELGFGLLGDVPAAPFRAAVVHEGGSRAAVLRVDEAARAGVALLLGAHRENPLEDDVNRVVDGPVPALQVQGRGQSLARVDVRLAGDLSKGFVLVPGAAQREEELDLLGEREREYRRRAAAAETDGGAEAARLLRAKAEELRGRAEALRREPLPEPPADRPSISIRFIPIVEALPQEPRVRAILAKAYGEMARLNLAAAKARARPCPQAAPGEPSFVGAATCARCHERAVRQWRGTGHARAYATLEKAASGPRHLDLDCVTCHVTGWRAPGGACSVAAVEGREAVQCEACHGPGSLHAADPAAHRLERDPGEERCRGCHTAEHSTAFDLPVYRRKILGPGHGAP